MDELILQEEIIIIGLQHFPIGKERLIKSIVQSSADDLTWAMYLAYCYGVMEGKREERAKRKLNK